MDSQTENMGGTFDSLKNTLEEETGLSGITITVKYMDSDGEVLSEKTF